MASDSKGEVTYATQHQHGLPPVDGRVALHASDRRMLLESHDGGTTLSMHTILQDTIGVQFSMTIQELADALDALGVKLPKPSKGAAKD